jgi:hypothetical protein
MVEDSGRYYVSAFPGVSVQAQDKTKINLNLSFNLVEMKGFI